ncbi:fungal-specific transcription factor domain-containing protein [Xylariaceae sp. FL0016]|nr:fungal-specific transcription factor domain-containing protein [Xylariaceae sp. FL0016]
MQQNGSRAQQQHQQQPPPPPPASPAKRPARSKNGCMTCRRRKVRCNEIRPICGHCSRLNLECRWRPTNVMLTNGGATANGSNTSRARSESNASRALSTPALPASSSAQESFDDVFNYASFMWDGQDFWKHPTWGQPGLPLVDQAMTNSIMTPSFTNTMSPPVGGTFDVAVASNHSDGYTSLDDSFIPANITVEDRTLLDYFIKSVVPPIIAQVETQSRWATMRQKLLSMSQSSPMLCSAILTFSSLLLSRQGDIPADIPADRTQKHYGQTASELAAHQEAGQHGSANDQLASRAAVLATLFFLSYTDLLEGRIELTHTNLKRAYDIYQSADKGRFRSVEVRLLSWIRLIDARAVSAGGQGLFLSESDEKLLAYSSPGSFDGGEPGIDEQPETDIEEVLFDILYQPGIVFFQKVQSFMGRISHQDPWHRHRGTVEDETEVMSIAAEISRDLRHLYDSRPPLMDYASAGLLAAPHISANLAFTITRAFRTFLSNFHASKIHLHRVAYKTLPLTKETNESIATIQSLAKSLVNGGDTQDMLPVNMLWPLLMWGSEEKSAEERLWIKTQILRMEKVATNARITSQVLEEVQTRQDSRNVRQDIREVMVEIFNSSWAIV